MEKSGDEPRTAGACPNCAHPGPSKLKKRGMRSRVDLTRYPIRRDLVEA